MDNTSGALARPVRAKLVHRDTAALHFDSAMASFGHEAGCIADDTPFAITQGMLAWGVLEKLECCAAGETC